MAGAAHQPLHVHALDAEALRLGHAARVGFGQGLCVEHGAQAAATATAHCLDHHAGVGVRGEEGARLLEAHRLRAAGQHRHAALQGQGARACLVAEELELLDGRADEEEPGALAGAREVGALAQEAVAGVDRVAAGAARDVDEARDVEVGGGPDRIEGSELVIEQDCDVHLAARPMRFACG